MSATQNNLKLVISNFVRNEYENDSNGKHIPIALVHVIMKFANKIIGSCLLTFKQDLDLSKLLKNQLININRFQLLFKARENNYSVNKFHNYCDNKGATLTIIKSGVGNVFGGYTSKSWTSNGTYVKDEDAFLFLIKSINEPLQAECPIIFKILKEETYRSILCNQSVGPTFASDLILSGTSGVSRKFSYDYGRFQFDNLNQSSTAFKLYDYEVFEVK